MRQVAGYCGGRKENRREGRGVRYEYKRGVDTFKTGTQQDSSAFA